MIIAILIVFRMGLDIRNYANRNFFNRGARAPLMQHPAPNKIYALDKYSPVRVSILIFSP